MNKTSEIRCPECNKLLAVRNGKVPNTIFEIKSKHDSIDVAFPFGNVRCKCGKYFILNNFTPFIYPIDYDNYITTNTNEITA